MLSLTDQLKDALSNGETERPVSKWLKENPLVLSHVTGGIAFPNKVVCEFPFGTDHRADFLTVGAFSGGWCVNCVELEPPDADLFTAKGVFAKRLNQAVAQVNTWKTFVENKRDAVLHELSKALKNKELVWGPIQNEPCDTTGWPLYHPKSFISFDYHIIIGRRHKLSPEQISLKSAIFRNHEINVMTYDRLLEKTLLLDSIDR